MHLMHKQIFIMSLRPRQNGGYFPDDKFKCIFLNENSCILMKISLKFVISDDSLALVRRQAIIWINDGLV